MANPYAALREKFVHYHKNPQDYLDLGSMRQWDGNTVLIEKKPIQDVLGLEFLGSGYYSNVYAIDDRRALKVVKGTDNSYASFVKFIKEQGNAFTCFPKIYYSGKWADKEIYIIERLIDNTDENRQDRVLLSDYCRRRAESNNSFISRFVAFPQEFVQGVEALVQYFRSSDGELTLDIHADNVMLRHNGDPVITDPFS